MMPTILIAVLLALPPEPPRGPADDFDEVIRGTEAVNAGCEAVSFERREADTIRRVLLRCPAGDAILTLVYDEGTGWWPVFVERLPRAPPPQPKPI